MNVGNGMECEIKSGKMIITIDLSANPDILTKSGKNHMVATTGPARNVEGPGLRAGAKLQVNLYEPLA